MSDKTPFEIQPHKKKVALFILASSDKVKMHFYFQGGNKVLAPEVTIETSRLCLVLDSRRNEKERKECCGYYNVKLSIYLSSFCKEKFI